MNLKEVTWKDIVLRLPELSAIVGIIWLYLLKMPNIIMAIKDSDLIRFLLTILLASLVAGIPCALLVLVHNTRIAAEELKKSREALEEVSELLRSKQ